MNLDLLNALRRQAGRSSSALSVYALPIEEARPFSLDSDAVEMIAEMSSPDRVETMIPHYRALARLPYPKVWLEFDYGVLAQWRRAHGQLATEPGDEAAGRLGFLLDTLQTAPEGFRATTFGDNRIVGSDDGEDFMTFPAVHNVWTGASPMKMLPHYSYQTSVRRALKRINDSRAPALAWAGAIHNSWEASPLYMMNSLEIEPTWLDVLKKRSRSDDELQNNVEQTLADGVKEQAGDLRFLVAALATINHVPVKFVKTRPNGLFRSRGRLRPHLETTVVSIDLPTRVQRLKVTDRLMKAAHEVIKRRWHEVRGHYRFSDTQHTARWEPRFDPRRNRMRWSIWIDQHARGDLSLGLSIPIYDVHGHSGAN